MTIIDKLLKIKFNEDSLLFNKEVESHYDATPIGAKVFACMGVDGVHYCIVPKDGDITLENSPVYRISPMDFSEGTIIWTAKNIYDFMGISIILKNFWLLPCLIGLNENEFIKIIKTNEYEFKLKEKNINNNIIKNINLLKKTFNTINEKNLYHYIQKEYSDDNNHIKLKFKNIDILEKKHGFYYYN